MNSSASKIVSMIEMEYFLSFEISDGGSECYKLALNVQKIKEVIELKDTHPLPPSHKPFWAMCELRGAQIPLMRLESVLFGREHNEPDHTSARIIICDLQNYYIGLVVTRTGRIIDTRKAAYLPPPQIFEHFNPQFMSGILKSKQETHYLLDIETILQSQGIELVKHRVDDTQTPKYEGKKVLIVEDSPLFQKNGARLFKSMGFEVDITSNGVEGWEALQKNRYDLIFCDIEMPLMNGVELIRRVKVEPSLKNIPVIFNTSLSNPGLIRDIEAANLGEYIVKYDEKLILEKVQKLLSRLASAA